MTGRRLLKVSIAGSLLVVAVAARLYALDRKSLWFDEGVSLEMARLPLDAFLSMSWARELNMLPYYAALRAWIALGEGETELRLLSVVFSVAAVAATFVLGRRLFGWWAGSVAAAVLALHAFDIRYAQEARAYSLAILLCVVSALLLVGWVERPSSWRAVAWAGVNVLALYAHFFCALVVVAQLLSLVALGWRALRSSHRELGVAAGIMALGALPIALFLKHESSGLDWVDPVTGQRVLAVLESLAGRSASLLACFAATFALVGALTVRLPPAERWKRVLVLAWALVPIACAVVVSFWKPVLMDRFVVMSVPAWALAVGVALAPHLERPSWRALPATAALAVVLGLELSAAREVYSEPFEDWRTPARQVMEAFRPGDVILFDSPWCEIPFDVYARPLARHASAVRRPPGSPLVRDYRDGLRAVAGARRVWLVTS
ncbi:MAG TPA: glycosyltransferase family 39 protein, partial [Anaeromyxobacteraceae bacterium]|nr:glycosyltransferase family 39 protein [Anaeromyxobacteraceae bacterium]